MTDAIRELIKAAKESRIASGRLDRAIVAAEKEMESESVVRGHSIILEAPETGRIIWAVGDYAIRRIEPEKPKVRPWAWSYNNIQDGFQTMWLCPVCGYATGFAVGVKTNFCCNPRCGEQWGEPRELPE